MLHSKTLIQKFDEYTLGKQLHYKSIKKKKLHLDSKRVQVQRIFKHV